jgi:O-antigen ligase
MTMASGRFALSEYAAALFVFSIIVFSYREGLTLVCQACGFLFIAVFLSEAMFRVERFRFAVPMPLVCFFAFVLYAVLSLIRTNQSMSFAATLLELFILSLFMINLILHQGNARWITYGFLAALLVSTWEVWHRLGGLAIRSELDRVSVFVDNSNTYAIALFIGIILCAEEMAHPREGAGRAGRIAARLTHLALILLFAYEIIFLTGSRKAMIAVLLFGFFVFLKVLVKAKFLQKIVILALGSGALAGLFLVMKNSVFFARLNRAYEMFTGKNVVEGSLNERAHMIGDGLRLWTEKPLFGWGTDQFRYLSGYQTYSHNNYVELLGNNGVVGLALYYAMIAVLLLSGLKLLLSGNERQKHYGWLNAAVLFILLFWDFALVSYYSKLQWVLLSVVIGLTCHAHRNLSANGGMTVAA